MPEYIEDSWCEGEVASVHINRWTLNYIGTDDGRGAVTIVLAFTVVPTLPPPRYR